MVIKHVANPLLPVYHVLTGQKELEAARSTDCSRSSSSAIGGGGWRICGWSLDPHCPGHHHTTPYWMEMV